MHTNTTGIEEIAPDAPEQEPMRFYLTQRLTRRDRPGGRGFDALFECQYMGSSEFEWGAVPQSLSRIRKASELAIHPGTVTRRGITVEMFVVGDANRVTRVPDALTAWLSDDRPRAKEWTHFPEIIEGAEPSRYYDSTHAWWSLDDDVMWALDRDTAEALLRGIRDTPGSR